MNSGPKRIEIFDTCLPGFGVRIGVNGYKSFFCVTRHLGRMRRFTLGPYSRLSLADAREAARKKMIEAQKNLPLAPESQKLKDVIRQFIELYARPKNRGWRDSERLLLRNFKSLLEMQIRDIKRTHVVAVLDGIMARGTPGTANHALSAAKKLFAWALDRGLIDIHPIAGLAPPGRKISRDLVLHEDELRQLLVVAEAEGYPFGYLLLLLLYLGQRRGEVAGMRWSELDLVRGVWAIPACRAKNGSAHVVPLAQPVLDILALIPRFWGSDFVFSTTGRTPVSGFGRAKERIEQHLGTTDWRIHDLRRTAATGMAHLGVAPHIIEKVLNHRTGQISGVAAVYNRYAYEEEKREALEKWADCLQQKVPHSANDARPSTSGSTTTRGSLAA